MSKILNTVNGQNATMPRWKYAPAATTPPTRAAASKSWMICASLHARHHVCHVCACEHTIGYLTKIDEILPRERLRRLHLPESADMRV
jgi:hypothetical protein